MNDSDDRLTAAFDEAGQPVPVTLPEDAEAKDPVLNLLGALEANGASFRSLPLMVAIVDQCFRDNGFAAEPNDDKKSFDRRMATAELLRYLTKGATPLQAGQRAFCLAYDLKLTTHETAAELAEALGITPARISQLRKEAFNTLLSQKPCEH